jgi:outer membrane protein assembly factor BamB
MRDEELKGGAGLQCLEADSGRTRWRVRTDASPKNSPVPTREGDCAVLSGTGRVYLIDGAGGGIRWQADLPGYPERWIYTAPAVADEAVYAGGKSGYGAYRLATGERLWYAPLEGSDNWSCYASPCVYQDLLIALVQRRGLVAMDRRSGKIVWEQKLGVDYQYGAPVLADGLLVSGGDARSLAVLRAVDGEVVWHRPVLEQGYASGLEVFGDRICATTPEGEVRCHDLRTGALRWRFRTGRDLLDMAPYRRNASSILGRPVAWGRDILAGGNDGVLYCLDRETGACLSRASFGAPISATPLVLEDGLCIGTWDGRLCCFRHGGPSAV